MKDQILKIEEATTDSGKLVGYRILVISSSDTHSALVFDEGLLGIRKGEGFIPHLNEEINYKSILVR